MFLISQTQTRDVEADCPRGRRQIARSKIQTRSFYIDKAALKKLSTDAKSKGMSTNALVNKVLHDYVEYQEYWESYGIITFSRNTFKDILDKLETKEIALIGAENGKRSFLSWASQKGYGIEKESLKSMLKMACVWGDWGTYMEEEANGKNVVSINHDLGIKFSYFLKAVIESIISLFPEKGQTCSEAKAFEKCVVYSC